MNKILLLKLLVLLSASYSTVIYAICSPLAPLVTRDVPFPSQIRVPASTLTNEIIAEVSVRHWSNARVATCANPADSARVEWEPSSALFSQTLDGDTPTGIDNVSMRIHIPSGFVQSSGILRIDRNAATCSTNPKEYCGDAWESARGVVFQLVKSGDGPVASGIISMSDTLTANLGRGILNSPLLRLKFPTIQILASSCSVSIPAPVNLGPITKGDLPLVGQPHATEKLFNLELTGCDGSNARVNLKLEGTTEPRYPAVLKSTGGASGVGIQVLNKNNNSNPITFGNEVVIGNTGGVSTYRIPLAARYFRVAEDVVAGTVRATAAFTVTLN